MGLLEKVLTPRGRKPAKDSSLPDALALQLPPAKIAIAPPTEAGTTRESGKFGKLLSAAGRLLTPRSGRHGEDSSASPFVSPRIDSSDSQRIKAYQPTLTGLMEGQLRLPGRATTPRPRRQEVQLETADPESDAGSDADSDLSSLDGFGEYARQLKEPTARQVPAQRTSPPDSSGSCSPTDHLDDLPSPRQLQAAVQLCSARPSARGSQQADEDLRLLLQATELPVSRQRLAHLVLYADSLGPRAFAGLSLHQVGFERCVALLLQLLLPLPLQARSRALAELQSQLASQLMAHLGSSLERVLESEKACQRLCRLPFEVAAWLLEHGPCDRGETLFDLGNLWLERQQKFPSGQQRRRLAALVWRRPLADNFLRCMAANLAWAADCVAVDRLRPARLPAALDGRFSFTAEFDLHDFLELQQAAVAEGKPQQQQSPAMYCGGLCWWALLSANPRHDRFELYLCCTPFSLVQEPFRPSLQPAADVKFCFQGKTSLAEWRQSNAQRLEAMHTHWGGAAFWAPLNGSAGPPADSGPAALTGPLPTQQQSLHKMGPMAAAARPDTARGPRPTRQPSRLSVSSGGSLHTVVVTAAALAAGPTEATSSSGLAGNTTTPLPPAPGRSGSVTSRSQLAPGYLSAADASGALTSRQPTAEERSQLHQLSMDEVIADVRRSCPYSWGASLRVRVHIKLLG